MWGMIGVFTKANHTTTDKFRVVCTVKHAGQCAFGSSSAHSWAHDNLLLPHFRMRTRFAERPGTTDPSARGRLWREHKRAFTAFHLPSAMERTRGTSRHTKNIYGTRIINCSQITHVEKWNANKENFSSVTVK